MNEKEQKYMFFKNYHDVCEYIWKKLHFFVCLHLDKNSAIKE